MRLPLTETARVARSMTSISDVDDRIARRAAQVSTLDALIFSRLQQ
jgi:hypothetical protein